MGASDWHGLVGVSGYAAGAAGAVTVPTGAVIIQISAHATSAGTLTILGGASIPIPAGGTFSLVLKHTLFQSIPGANTCVFTGTDQYFVHWVREGHAV